MCIRDRDIKRFPKDDVACALEMFNEAYVTFPRADIATVSYTHLDVYKRQI